MPDPPHVGLLTRFVLENPWPLGGALVLAAMVIAWLAAREGRFERLRLAALPLVAGVAVLGTGATVTTSGERARDATIRFVDAVVAEDLTASVGLLAENATLHFGAVNNPGRDTDAIVDGLSQLAARYEIESNRVTRLGAYTTGPDAAVVHLGCSTVAGRGYGHATPSRWILEFERGPDDALRLRRLVCISVANGAPPARW